MAGLLDFLQSASNASASTVSGPVDMLSWLLQKAGVPVGNAPPGGSAWMEQKGLTKPVKQSAASLAGETVGLLSPTVAAAKAPQIAKGLLQVADNAAAPSLLNKQRGIFVGDLSKTWDQDAFHKAKSMERNGADAKAIWQETGSFKGPDGKWRQEISDNAASVKGDPLPQREIGGKMYADFKVGDAMNHQALFDAYPDLAKVEQSFMRGGANGEYRPGMDWIALDSKYERPAFRPSDQAAIDFIRKERQSFAETPRVKRYNGLLDAIADKHGFGDRLDKAVDKFGSPITRTLNDISRREKDAIASASNGAGVGLSPSALSIQLHELQHAIQQRQGFAPGGSASEFVAGAKLNPSTGQQVTAEEAHNMYLRLAGEAEARAVQKRMNLTPAERRALFPLDSYDVPLDKLIVR